MGTATGALPTIVIVDDAEDVRMLVRTRLRMSGLVEVVGEGANGAEAVRLAGEHRPDLMLLDVSMPVMDGLEALPRALEESPDTCVVMFSGFQEQGLAQRARDLGAVAFLEKSTPLKGLAGELMTLLERSGRGAAPAEEPREPRLHAVPEPVEPAEELEPAEQQPEPTGSADRQQAVLDEHLERFREVFDDAAIGMATVTLAGKIVRANASLGVLLGRTASGLVGTSYGEFAGDRVDLLRAALDEILTGHHNVAQLEHEVVGRAGARVLATLAPVLDSRGRPLYLFLQVQDVTAQREAESQLRQSEARFRLIVESVQDYAIFMLSPDGIVQTWNAGAERIKGYAEHEIVGRHFRTFYPHEARMVRHPEHELELAIRDGRYEEEGWRIRKDGTGFWANVVITALHDDDGRHVGFAKVTRDVSERRAAEEALRQSEERFRLLVEAVGDYAIFMLDPTGRVMSWNAGAERSNGYRATEIIGQHFRVFYPPERQAERHPERELELALRDGRYEEEGWRIRKDGTEFWANVVITSVHDEDGRHVGFAKVTRDTTERRRMLDEREASARALAEANEQLRMAADDQAHFLAVTAHELRTPVAVLGGTADTLAAHWQHLDDEERAELLGGMTASAARLRRLLGDLITASRLQTSRLELDLATCDLAEVVGTAAASARQTHPGAEIHVDSEPGLCVVADRDRLAQAVDNLVGNALRHGAPPVHLTARAVGDRVEVTVRDSGAGVGADMQPRLFDRFATGRSKGGTGLGLYIVRQLARAHGGDATYAAEDGAGGAFVISLPRQADQG